MPSRKNPMGQSRYFYTTTWTKRVDHAFINMLYYQDLIGQKQSFPLRLNEEALQYAANTVNRYADREWPLDFFKSKLSLLRLRHDWFRRTGAHMK
ncbi:UNVERIFIED_CONTAM: hypothetical protein Slati_4171800 [Sesamum latifolium]|uniref:Uncharacterized protein n=1 Tax=Sesamum latifolium TaxID=2727402 RepID=A0AAW2TA82_9LAMI